MPLIKTITEIRKYVRMSKLSNDALMPDMDKAAFKHIVPIIGAALYADIQTKYNAANLSAEETILLENLQRPLAAGAMYDELKFMHTTITDNGIRTPESSNMRPSQRWEYNYLKEGLADLLADGQEMLLHYLFQKKASYPLWTASDAYKTLSGRIITTATDFDAQYKLQHPFRTFWLLAPIMADVEENYLAGAMGRDLLEWCRGRDKVEVDDGAMVDVKKLLKKSVAHLSIKHACEQSTAHFGTVGFTIAATMDINQINDGTGPATTNDIQAKKQAADRDGQNFLGKSISYLVRIANGEFYSPFTSEFNEAFGTDFIPAFENSPLYTDPSETPASTTNGNERRRGVFRLGS